jgi:hypothetical protein
VIKNICLPALPRLTFLYYSALIAHYKIGKIMEQSILNTQDCRHEAYNILVEHMQQLYAQFAQMSADPLAKLNDKLKLGRALRSACLDVVRVSLMIEKGQKKQLDVPQENTVFPHKNSDTGSYGEKLHRRLLAAKQSRRQEKRQKRLQSIQPLLPVVHAS